MTFAESIQALKEQRENPAENIDFPQYRGLSFRDFWLALPHKLDYFDYEEELHNILEHPEEYPPEQRKHLWVKKATGLGITEFMIRYIAWKCLKDDEWKDKQIDVNVVIIVGPRIDLAITIMGRLKKLFGDHEFKSKETVVTLNGSRIEVFPSHHLAPARGLNPLFVFLDEADFFPPQMQAEARMVSERYIAKTDPYITMVSTPNLPLGLYDTMEREEESIYVRKALNYEIGLGKVFTPEAIEKARRSPSFEREYNLQYGYGVGDIFQGIDDIVEEYDVSLSSGRKCICADPAFGSSDFGICGGEQLDGIGYVKEARQYKRPSYNTMLDVMAEMSAKYDRNAKVDAAHPGFIRDLQDAGISARPVNFGLQVKEKEGDDTKVSFRHLLATNAADLVKEKKVRIHPMFKDLIAQLRSVKFDEKGGPDKKELTFDIGDAFLMWCWELNHGKSVIRKLKGSF